VSLGAILIALILLYYPLQALSSPIKELIRVSSEVAAGNFSFAVPSGGIGEVSQLSQAFRRMGTGIDSQLKKREEKGRKDGSQLFAKTLHAQLLSRPELPSEAGVELAVRHFPGRRAANLWFSWGYHADFGESHFALAEINSTTETEATIYSTALTVLFDELLHSASATTYPLSRFADRANKMFLYRSEGKVQASLLFGRFQREIGEWEILSAGHHAPFLFAGTSTKSLEPLRSSRPIGDRKEFVPATARVKAPKNSSLLIFSRELIGNQKDADVFAELSRRIVPSDPPDSLLAQIEKTDHRDQNENGLYLMHIKRT
jgi:HAMP domain-containing protein